MEAASPLSPGVANQRAVAPTWASCHFPRLKLACPWGAPLFLSYLPDVRPDGGGLRMPRAARSARTGAEICT